MRTRNDASGPAVDAQQGGIMSDGVKLIISVSCGFIVACVVYVVIMSQREPEHFGPHVRNFADECARRVSIPCNESERAYYERVQP